MKRKTVLIVTAVSAIAGCTGLERNYDALPKRSDVYSEGRLPEKYFGELLFSEGDTSLLVCGIETPDGYDWQTDSAMGISSRCKLVLFKNSQKVLSFQTGYDECISTDPDTHHLIGPHLYTEFSTSDSTIIKRDGKWRTSFSGREFLLGLLEKDGEIHTLSEDRGGAYLAYRVEGRQIMKMVGARAYGSFGEASYPRTGALYEDGESVYFAYKMSVSGMLSDHIVRDGIDIQINNKHYYHDIDDIKVRNGRILGVGPRWEEDNRSFRVIYPESATLHNTDRPVRHRRLYPGGEYAAVFLTEYTSSMDSSTACKMYYAFSVVETFPPGEYYAFWDGKKVHVAQAVEKGNYIFTRSCVDFFNGIIYKAVTPADRKKRPFVLKGDDQQIMNLKGYLTGVEVYVSPPS